MSRSRRKNPFAGITTASSEKADKRAANRLSRRTNEQILYSSGDETALKHTRETSNLWAMAKDGKKRFDPMRHPALLRK